MQKVLTIMVLAGVLLLGCKTTRSNKDVTKEGSYLKVVFKDSENYQFSDSEKDMIEKIATLSDKEIRKLLPSLTKDLTLTVIPVEHDLEIIYGVTGQADTPHEVTAEISYIYKDGVSGAVMRALSGHIYHEFHHVWRGWTMTENEFEKGISIAAVNEGLAEVFSKTYTGVYLDIGDPSDDVESWTQEVLKLPKDANYNKWMMQHDDGRLAIGYRVGTYIVERALKNSNMTIVELSDLQVNEILKLSGVYE